jgi:glycosyltransferase involved in cell wall biosynthesis
VKHLLYIGNKLAKNGGNPTGIDVLGPLLELEGYSISYASTKRNRLFRLLEMLFATCFARNIDYVLIDTYSTTNFWYAYWVSQLCRLRRLKYIPILHGGNLPNRWQTHPKSCQRLFYHAYRNVCPSLYLMKAFGNVGCPNLVHVPNAINLENYVYKERPLANPKILWVRAFAALYNPEMAIHVFDKLLKTFPNAELCMVGPDKDGSSVKAKKLAESLGVQVDFKGKLTRKEWTELAQNYDIFINTTHFDNTPVSVIEAMSLGLAVVSTNVGGLPFLINNDEDGLLVADNDVEGMHDALLFLLKNPSKFIKITKKARIKAYYFDWNQVKDKWFLIFNNGI